MNINIGKIWLPLAVLGCAMTGCKKWGDHTTITDVRSDKDLVQQISENTDLSKFAALLTRSGYAVEIAVSKTFTVYAPTNAALAALDPTIENDEKKLREFVSNHITTQTYFTTATDTLRRIRFLNNKYHNIKGKQIDDAAITSADNYAKNGVLQIIGKMLPVRSNTWQFLERDPSMPLLQKTFMQSLFMKVFDPANAVQTGVDTAGRPVYQPGTDSVISNIYWRNVYDLRDESKQFTFFALTDDAYTNESLRLRTYYTDTINRTFTQINMVNDYTIEGAYDVAQLPDTIVSKFNVKLGISKNDIIKTVKTSNGYVHIINKMTVRLQDKFKQYVIQAENYQFTNADRTGNIYIRDINDPVTGLAFRDLLVWDHKLALFNLGYRLSSVPAGIRYKVYWVAVNNNINRITTTFTQKLGIDTATSVKYFGYVTVPLNSYAEQYLGEFMTPYFRSSMNIYLTAANNATAATSAIVCDYIRFEPVFN